MQDTQLLQLGPVTELAESIFEIKPYVIRPYEFFDDVHTSVSFEFDLNFYRIDRETYNTLDWFADLGGLYEALVILLTIIYGLVHYHAFRDYLVSKVYKPPSKADRNRNKLNSVDESSDAETIKLNPNKLSCLMKRITELRCCLCRCMSKETRQRYKTFEKGRKLLETETDIVNLIQEVRAIW